MSSPPSSCPSSPSSLASDALTLSTAPTSLVSSTTFTSLTSSSNEVATNPHSGNEVATHPHSGNEVATHLHRGGRYWLRNITKSVMKKKVPLEVAKRAIELFDFEKGCDEQPPERMNELERMLGMEGVEWPSPGYRLMMIYEKLDKELIKILRSYGYGWFAHYGENKKLRLEISPKPGKEPLALPEWLQIPYLVPVKEYSFRIIPDSCANPSIQDSYANPVIQNSYANPIIQEGDHLYDKDHRKVGSLGVIMASDRPGRKSLIYAALTAGHVIPDGDDALLIKNRKDDSFISLTVASKSLRIRGRPIGRLGRKPNFQDDVGLLIVNEEDVDQFKHSILNMNVYFFNLRYPTDNEENISVSDMLDPAVLPRKASIKQRLRLGPIVVFKVGGETDLTIGYFVKTSPSAPKGWYQNEDQDNEDDDNNDNDSDEDDDEDSEGWMGVVKWGNTPFSAPGDSGSLVFAVEDGITIPLGIHVGSPESLPNQSVFIGLETFCFEAEREGLELRFTQY